MKSKNKITNYLKNPIVIFIKGSKEMPQCGFSAQAIQILNLLDADYKDIDILKDEDLRQDLKVYSDWPTYPQLYINGELIGGIDIMKELMKEGELETLLFENE